MSRLGFEPTIPEFEPAKTVHALDRVATVIGRTNTYKYIYIQLHIGLKKLRGFSPQGNYTDRVIAACRRS
jgi:hypothetical protein